ncbi:MAG: DNA repair protein RecN [Spirochaetaceae bacterium]|jgi:DNA repair protein RecN (Recombination protein N)|nr:DNA repair protein RecN [Spirochaetaceae bacterium]
MLLELSIRNYALIENLTISFDEGLSILTGETGAGKSIIVGALGFLLGAKADTTVIRSGADEASVSAVISIDGRNRDALDWLAAHGIEPEDGCLTVRRGVKASGRGSIWIRDAPVTRTELSEFMSFMFDLHGQHAHQSLLHKDNHRRSLDRFAGIEDETAAFNRVFTELAEKRKNLENSLVSERDRDARIELLTFSIDEIDKARLKSGESRELEAESARLASFEKLRDGVETAAQALFDGEASALSLSRKAKAGMDAAAALDSSLSGLQQRLTALYYEAEDLSGELRSYRNSLTFDPSRLEELGERLALIHRLKKKYGGKTGGEGAGAENAGGKSIEDAIIAYRNGAAAEIEALSASEENREKQRAAIAALERDIAKRAASLSASRRAASDKLARRITEILGSLGMPGAVFTVNLAPKGPIPGGQANLVCGPWGADDVEFLIAANKGESARELRLVASGGELSRVMLAIKTALAAEGAASGAAEKADGVETLIFDEIDTGIGGEAAVAVGEYLQKIGGLKQIFCVTHLAVIACRADNHFRVEKTEIGGRTITSVNQLSVEERRNEIARMLSGGKGETALAHACELLERYGVQ